MRRRRDVNDETGLVCAHESARDTIDGQMRPKGQAASSQREAASRPRSQEPAGRAGKEPLVERAYREIRRRIVDNEYPAAHQVLERELVADLGMSRTPVREALIRLQNEQLVQIIPRHGMRVVPLSLEDLREMYEVLTALELAAIERLIKSGPSDEQLRELADALEEMDVAVRDDDADAWVRADERFHRTLIVLAGNSRLAAMAFALWDQGHRARTTTVRLRGALEDSNREHAALVEAIRKGDLAEARACHTAHRARTSAEILTLLDRARMARI